MEQLFKKNEEYIFWLANVFAKFVSSLSLKLLTVLSREALKQEYFRILTLYSLPLCKLMTFLRKENFQQLKEIYVSSFFSPMQYHKISCFKKSYKMCVHFCRVNIYNKVKKWRQLSIRRKDFNIYSMGKTGLNLNLEVIYSVLKKCAIFGKPYIYSFNCILK